MTNTIASTFGLSWVILIVLNLLVAVAAVSAISDDLVVHTTDGPVKGYKTTSYEGRPVLAWEGIPYAKPPVGELRFKEPQPPESWTDILEANNKCMCLQYNSLNITGGVLGSEDCLLMNVYVPKDCIEEGKNLNVVIHIHGGGYTIGSPNLYAEPTYVMDRCLIYVSMCYRLGILGFYSTQDEVCPGNNGMKDQVLALKWVKNNIEKFGGNPDTITLAGWSAGASSVHLHMLSPLSKGLFARALSHSGTALNLYNFAKDPKGNAKRLAAHFNCTTASSEAMVECVRSVPVEELVSSLGIFFVLANIIPIVPFAPVVERYTTGAFLPDHPYTLLMEGKISNDCPWVASNVKNEGLVIPMELVLLYGEVPYLDENWYNLAADVLEYNDTVRDADKPWVSKDIRNHYFGNKPLSVNEYKNLIQLYGDRLFYVDGTKAITLHAKKSKSPVYYFKYEYYIDISDPSKANLTAVAHGDDTRLLYRRTDNPPVLTESDTDMKNVLLDFLYNYASGRKPSFNGQTWLPLNSNLVTPTSYLRILSPDNTRKERAIDLSALSFWHNIPTCENENLYCRINQLENKRCNCMSIIDNRMIWSYQDSCTPFRHTCEGPIEQYL